MQELQEILSKTSLTKAEQRLSKQATDYKIGQKYQEKYTILGLYRNNKDLILKSEEGNYFLENMNNKKQTKPKETNIEIVKIEDVEYDPSIFVRMVTNTPIDFIFSNEGGIYPATNFIIAGDPGIGKSTQTLDICANVIKSDPTKQVLFISGEMNKIDMYGYCQRYPEFAKIPTLFMADHLEENTKDVLETVYNQGWDLILIDSFSEVQETIQETCDMSRNAAEKWMIQAMVKNNQGQNALNKYTTFIAIQQVNKSGNFVGSNKLKHNTTGMFELRFSQDSTGDRYIKVLKNRRGFKYNKIYFSLENHVSYDEKRILRDLEIAQKLNKERILLQEDEEKFESMFRDKTDEE